MVKLFQKNIIITDFTKVLLFCFFFSWRKKSLDSQLGVLKCVARSTGERSCGCGVGEKLWQGVEQE